MLNFKKLLNLNIIPIIAVVTFYFTSTLYGIDLSCKDCLRAPLLGSKQEISERFEKSLSYSESSDKLDNIKNEKYPEKVRTFTKLVPGMALLMTLITSISAACSSNQTIIPSETAETSIVEKGSAPSQTTKDTTGRDVEIIESMPAEIKPEVTDIIKEETQIPEDTGHSDVIESVPVKITPEPTSADKGETQPSQTIREAVSNDPIVVDPVFKPVVIAEMFDDNDNNIEIGKHKYTSQNVRLIKDINDSSKKALVWSWSQSYEKYSALWENKYWKGGASAIDVTKAGISNCVFRFVISGTQNARFAMRFKDDKNNGIEVPSYNYVYVLGKQQYVLVRLEEIERIGREQNIDFDWSKFKGIEFGSLSEGNFTVTIADAAILNVKKIRDRGVGVGIFRGGANDEKGEDDGNQFPVLEKWDRRSEEAGYKPISVLSFTGIYEDLIATGRVEQWKKLAKNNQIPHDTLEFNIQGGNIFDRILSGEFDDLLIKRAKDIAEYGGLLLERVCHEANGGWYPWSVRNKTDADKYIDMWQHIYKIYHENGADNVRFIFAIHNYEPDNLEQEDYYELMEYVLSNIKEEVDLIGLDAYSYPPSGGFLNELITGMVERLKKFDIPMVLAEFSSGMPEDHDIWPKWRFWEYLNNDLQNGMFPEIIAMFIFNTAKEENGWKDFRVPVEIVEKMQKDPFYFTNPILPLFGQTQPFSYNSLKDMKNAEISL
jgi:hypothetical protein